MDERGNTVKCEKILLGFTALFLAFLLALFFRDRAALEAAPVTVETEAAVPQEAFMPDVSPLDINAASAEELAARNALVKGAELAPVYHRLSQAERERLEKESRRV